MGYSNGFDLDVVLPALTGRVGWASDAPPVSFESFHPICTEKNLRDTQPNETLSDSGFQDYKDQLESDVILKTLRAIFNRPEYIDQVLLHNRVFDLQPGPISNTGQFCGIRLKVAPDFGVSVHVQEVTLLFDSNTTFSLYLFKDGDPTALGSISVTAVANRPTVVDVSALPLLSYGKTGAVNYYLGYFQDDLSGAKALQEQVTRNCAKAFSAVYIQAPKATSTTINQAQISYGQMPYGLNAKVLSFRDYTYKIVNQAYLFDEALGLQMVKHLIEQVLYTTRSNVTERILSTGFDRAELMTYVNGGTNLSGTGKKDTSLVQMIDCKMKDIREAFYPQPKLQTVGIC